MKTFPLTTITAANLDLIRAQIDTAGINLLAEQLLSGLDEALGLLGAAAREQATLSGRLEACAELKTSLEKRYARAQEEIAGLKAELERARGEVASLQTIDATFPAALMPTAEDVARDAHLRRLAVIEAANIAKDPEARHFLPADYRNDDGAARAFARGAIARHRLVPGAPWEELDSLRAAVTEEELDLFVAVLRG